MKKSILVLVICLAEGLVSCSKENQSVDPKLTLNGSSTVALSADGSEVALSFKCNTDWELSIPAEATWIKADPVRGTVIQNKDLTSFKIKFSALKLDGDDRSAKVRILYGGDKFTEITVSQTALARSNQFDIPNSMLFSTTLGRNTTNVCQGFDYDPAEDVIYITSKYGTYQNHIGWQKRETASSTTVAPNYMTLRCFSHGNNIAVEKSADGKKYVWAPNYADRQDDGSYDKPKVISRFPLESGKTLYNTETTENYYFGLNVTWPAFDFENDMMAVCDYSNFYVYRISEIMALPVETVTLGFKITYGGSSPVDTKKPEWSGYPVISARDCRKAKVLYTVPFTYKQRNLHWQSYCIDNGWIFAILAADTKKEPEIIYDTFVEAYKMDGSRNIYSIRQEYMQNRERILEFNWTERDYFYCEPEGIKVRDGVMYLLYCMKGKTDAHNIRRPVVFRLASPLED